jgi:Adenylate and Guanylate cyclase catalytic domain/Double zinc ribbon
MRCPRCEADNPEGMKFCIECAAPLTRCCPQCGFANPPQAKFCGQCATSLTGQSSGSHPSSAAQPPLIYTPGHLAEKILTSKTALEGERKQVTVLFADLKGSMELLAHRDPEESRQLLDPVLERMMQAVHRYEGPVNQVMGDGIMAPFGAPLAHEDHAVRACYAALAMQTAIRRYSHVEERDDAHTIRAKVIGQVLTLDAALQNTLPALLALLDALPADSPFRTLDPPQRRQRTLDACKGVLLRESQVQPLLLVFEDLHWIDSETQALLDSLVESLPTARLLLLVNYRPEYQHGWGSKTYYTQVRLDPLPPAGADEVLQALLGDDPSLAALKRLLIARTEGNPFFLEESVRMLVETGVLVGEPGACRLAQSLPTIQVPATVQAVLAARIDRLPPEDKRLLQTAAVIGTEVPLPLLQAIAELPEGALHRELAHLQAAEFLYEIRLFPDHVYTLPS